MLKVCRVLVALCGRLFFQFRGSLLAKASGLDWGSAKKLSTGALGIST